METDLIKHFFPVELLDHFEYRSSQIKMGEHGEYLEVEFEEKNELSMYNINNKTKYINYLCNRIAMDFNTNAITSLQAFDELLYLRNHLYFWIVFDKALPFATSIPVGKYSQYS
jgi:hypothetical protein